MPDMTHLLHSEFPNVTIPSMNAFWLNHDQQNYPLFQLYHQFKVEQIYPEYIWGHHGDGLYMSKGEDYLFLKALEKFKEWYEVVDTLHGKNMVMIHDLSLIHI